MSQHNFTTPRVVYLGQAYRGREEPGPAGEPQARQPGLAAPPTSATARIQQESWTHPVSSAAASR